MFADKLKDFAQPLIIAEIAQNHDGSLGACHAYIDALAAAGVDAVKFQTHIAAEESTLDEPFRVKFSQQDATRYDYWKRMEFSEEQWASLKKHAEGKGITFLSTPFSVAAVEMLSRIGVPAWKVGSGDTLSRELLAAILATKLPLMVSTGMSNWAEIDALVEMLKGAGADFALMQCTSMYPTPLAKVGLNVLEEMQQRYGCRIGLSDHSAATAPAMTALARGFGLIEVHATFDRRMFGPDVTSSLTVDEIASLVRYARELAELNANPVDKDAMAAQLAAQKQLFAKSIALKADLPAGHVLSLADITSKKPASGIAWEQRDAVIGKRLKRNVAANVLLKNEDFE